MPVLPKMLRESLLSVSLRVPLIGISCLSPFFVTVIVRHHLILDLISRPVAFQYEERLGQSVLNAHYIRLQVPVPLR
jgi:hypothetical protein